jgi:hypothetical protein
MTVEAVIDRARAAGWFVESLYERRGGPKTWVNGPWSALLRNRSGERFEGGSGGTAAEALAAALAETIEPTKPLSPTHMDLLSL